VGVEENQAVKDVSDDVDEVEFRAVEKADLFEDGSVAELVRVPRPSFAVGEEGCSTRIRSIRSQIQNTSPGLAVAVIHQRIFGSAELEASTRTVAFRPTSDTKIQNSLECFSYAGNVILVHRPTSLEIPHVRAERLLECKVPRLHGVLVEVVNDEDSGLEARVDGKPHAHKVCQICRDAVHRGSGSPR
jgi:hypothetical protein